MNGLLHPKTDVPKTYVLKVKGKMTPSDLDQWRNGIELSDGRTKPAQVKFDRHEEDKTWFYVTLTEGRNQQIRRMGEATGFMVMRLSRVAFAGITTEGLPPGGLRALTRDELMDLKKRFGVPKRLPHASPEVAAERGHGHGHGRVRQSRVAPVKSSRDERAERTRGGGREKKRGMHRSESPSQGSTTRESNTQGPRYGGGSPGRRSYGVTEDWGGGSGRGRSFGGASGNSSAGARDDVSGGRSGRTRTTGTSGGIGSSSDADRVKGRRGNRG
jgi:23S rRNA pseudouridine2605 synthase